MDTDAHKNITGRLQRAKEIITDCTLCPHNCRVNRAEGFTGVCRLDPAPHIFREMLHFGEESMLNPSHQIYFSGCNLDCGFCTVAEFNAQPAQLLPVQIDLDTVADEIQKKKKAYGAKNINLLGGEPAVSLPGVLQLLAKVDPRTTVVFNSNMYFNPVVTEIMDGLADIYLADIKAAAELCCAEMLGAENYFFTVTNNILRASQVSNVIVRHLIIPGHIHCCTMVILQWLKDKLPGVKLSLRADYVPPAQTGNVPDKYLDQQDYNFVLKTANDMNLNLIK